MLCCRVKIEKQFGEDMLKLSRLMSGKEECGTLRRAWEQLKTGTTSHTHYHILTLSHPHTITSSHYHILTLSHPHTITTSHYHYLTLIHVHVPSRQHYIIVTSHHHTLTLSLHCRNRDIRSSPSKSISEAK